MDEIPLPGTDLQPLVKQFLAHYDAPAYVRRARQVQEAFELFLARCLRQREEWLGLVRTRLGIVQGLAGSWEVLRPWLTNDDQVLVLERLAADLQPVLRIPVLATTSGRALRRALRELQESLVRFNYRWQAYLEERDLSQINALRADYNRYYLLEKECAMRSPRLARQGYRPLPPLTMGELALLLPSLPVLDLAGTK